MEGTVKEKIRKITPGEHLVSCTEQGRWTCHSKTFSESGIMMSPENTTTRDDGRMYGYERRAAFRNRRRDE